MHVGERTFPEVSVVIAARDSEATIGACLESLLRQSMRPAEILVADDHSTDGTAALARQIGQHHQSASITVFEVRGNGASDARNEAIRMATADFVAFLDADCVAPREWLEKLVNCMQSLNSSRVAAVGGPQMSPPGEHPFARDVHEFLVGVGFLSDYARQAEPTSTHGDGPAEKPEPVEVPHVASCNALYHRSALLAVGGFRSGLWPGEDTELDRRLQLAGYRIMFDAGVPIGHHRPASWTGFGRMMWRYGWAQGVLVRLHGWYRPIHAVPLLVGGAAAGMVALAGISWALFGGVLLLVLMMQFALVAMRGLLELGALRSIALLLVTVTAWNLGFVDGVLSNEAAS